MRLLLPLLLLLLLLRAVVHVPTITISHLSSHQSRPIPCHQSRRPPYLLTTTTTNQPTYLPIQMNQPCIHTHLPSPPFLFLVP
ncbi:hypothetical protein IWX90DRAFT_434434 [Phyllosticta citrichinensis]|uniref:Secreted protein n=1 Tax=Phyllosticta citrichinensis TaxID=1130410 RepID=A0ABR1XV23_9PEZI